MSSFTGKNVVVMGATGNLGSGAVNAFLQEGATVIAVSRSDEKLKEFKATFFANEAGLLLVSGSVENKEAADKLVAKIQATLGADKHIDHVVSNIGMGPMFNNVATEGTPAQVEQILTDAIYPTMVAASAFVPLMKKVAGSSYTIVSGGMAWFCPPGGQLWPMTLKNAALNAYVLGLASECAGDAVRVNTLNPAFNIAAHGQDKNQWGLDAVDTYKVGYAFAVVAAGTQRGEHVKIPSEEFLADFTKQFKQ